MASISSKQNDSHSSILFDERGQPFEFHDPFEVNGVVLLRAVESDLEHARRVELRSEEGEAGGVVDLYL